MESLNEVALGMVASWGGCCCGQLCACRAANAKASTKARVLVGAQSSRHLSLQLEALSQKVH
jgi:hypothetical protein